MRIARRVLPQPIKGPIGDAWRRGEDALRYLQGKNVLRRYAAHHREARRIFTREGNRPELAFNSICDLGVRPIRPGAGDNMIAVPADYLALVARIAEAVRRSLEQSANCYFVPQLPDGPMAERTEEIAAVRNGEVIAIQLINPYNIDGVSDLSTPIVKELERAMFGSYAIVDKVYIYRSPVSRQTPRASWLWHYDNHPPEVVKVMIYLTDVDEGAAPFEYLRHTRSSAPLPGSPVAPLYRRSRIGEEEVRRRMAEGFERQPVLGSAGTMVIFDSNVVHRGTLAREAHRDVLVFQVRPVTFRAEHCISDGWTGSFQHFDVNPDPRDLTPHRKR